MNKDWVISKLEKDIACQQMLLSLVSELPDDGPGRLSFTDSLHWHVESWGDFRAVRKIFKSWKYQRSYTMPDDGRRVFVYHEGDVELFLTFEPPCNEGDMCQRVKVGVEEVPLYKIVCGTPAGHDGSE